MAAVADEICILEGVLNECVRRYRTDDARMFTVFDREQGHFLVIEEGWNRAKRLYNPFVHLERRDGLVWVQHDYTNHGIAHDLIAAGIPQERDVLAYKPVSLRAQTDFAAV